MRNFLMVLITLFATTGVIHAQDTGRAGPPSAESFRLDPVVTGFPRALYVTHAGDGSGRLFLVQQNGVINVIEDNTSLETPFLDVSQIISQDALSAAYTERGLLGLAFDPDYDTNGYFYINYTERDSNDTVVARYSVSDTDPNAADPESGVELFRQAQPFANHNGGHLSFGPDGYLYISLGDGGSQGDPMGNGQDPSTVLGTLLRVDVTDNGLVAPPDNPFIGNPDGNDLVWAYGLRNVWRFSFDRATDEIYLGDVGQNRWEEINVQPAGVGGQNYGWSVFEATQPYSGAAAPADVVMPVAEYQHINGNCSVTGGYVYRGEQIPALQGAYIYGDFCSGQLWSLYRDTNGTWQSSPLTDTPYTISSFGQGPDGELYLVHFGSQDIPGQVLRFSPVN